MRISILVLIFWILTMPSWGLDIEDQGLIFSNYPETIRQTGVVYNDELDWERTRFSYYHKNGMEQTLFYSIMIQNMSDTPATVNITYASGAPNKEGLAVGHQTAYNYLNKLQNNSSNKIRLEANEARKVHLSPFAPNSVICGLLRIKKSKQARIKLDVAVLKSRQDTLSRIKTAIPYFTCGVYQDPQFQIDAKFDFSIPIYKIKVGGQPFLVDIFSEKPLKGNYAAAYTIKTQLYNKFDTPITVDILFSPLAGAARGSFMIDNKLVQNNREKNYVNIQPEKLMTYHLKPQEVRDITIHTLPESGAFYPLNIVFKKQKKMKKIALK